MPVGIYLRVSTQEQRERQSIITQRAFAEQYCALHQLQIYTFYTDDAVSGTVPLPLRPGGLRALEDAREHRFEQLLVYKLDRLGRDTRLTLEAVAELEKCGVRVKSMTEEFDTATASGRLMLTMLSGFAAHERDVIRERSLAGTNRVAHTGCLFVEAKSLEKDLGDRKWVSQNLSYATVVGVCWSLGVRPAKLMEPIP